MEVTMDRIKELENEIYDTYYELNPEGDARFGLWKDVIDAKKEGVEAMEVLLDTVKNDIY
jgi:DNA-binding PadR family transcriptional regulator